MLEQLQETFERGTKDGLKVQALTQRIAQLVAQYEDQLAEFRADATVKIETLTKANQAQEAELTTLRAEKAADEVSEEEAPATDEG